MKLLLTLMIALVVCTAPADAQDRRGRFREDRGPKVGEDAPDFELELVVPPKKGAKKGKADSAAKAGSSKKNKKKKSKTLKLSSFEGKKPVVLVFGSFT